MRGKIEHMMPLLGLLLLIGGCAAGAPAGAPAGGQRGTRVSINADNVLVIDGQKVFPIGFTMPPPADGMAPGGRNAIEELSHAGATFLRTGVMGGPWDEAAIAREQQYQDAAARYGMHCLVNLREHSALAADDPQAEDQLRRLVERFKDHPGMGVWKGSDEPDWMGVPVQDTLRAYRILRQVDPHHPVWIVQAPRGTIESMRAYLAACDITGADIYPVSYPPGTHSLLPNKSISLVGDHTRIMMEVADGTMPVWMVLQIAWSGTVKEGKTLRMPTLPEQRFMTYQAIINGARGIIYFGGHIPKAMSPRDRELGWNWSFWQRVLRPVIEEIGRHGPLYPALVAPDSKLPIRVSGADDIEFCVREVGDEIFILACKRGPETVQVRFQGLPEVVSPGEVLFEAPRTIVPENGEFTDWFAPFEVHVYRLRRR